MFDLDPTKTLVAAQQKNLDAFVKASTIFSEGMQVVLKRQIEIAQASIAAGMAAAQSGGSVKDFDVKKQMDALQTVSEKALAEAKELVDLATSSSTQAFEVLRARNEEAVAEMKAMIKTS